MKKRIGIVLIIIILIINIVIIYKSTQSNLNNNNNSDDVNNIQNEFNELNSENINITQNNVNENTENNNTNTTENNKKNNLNIENEITSNNFEKVNKYWADSDGNFIAMSGFITNIPSLELNQKDGYIQISFSEKIEENYNILLLAYKGKDGEYVEVEYKDKVQENNTIELKSENNVDLFSKTFDLYIILKSNKTNEKIFLNLNCNIEEAEI